MSRSAALAVSLLSALPLLALKLVYISDVPGWNNALGYGLYLMVLIGAAIGWILYLAAECLLRRKNLDASGVFPSFSLLAAIALVLFVFVGEWSKPLVYQRPDWCRVTQSIEWPTANGTFYLVLVARGNLEEHKFSSGWLNWSGEGLAGVSSLDFDPITFSWWEGYTEVTVEGTPQQLREHLAPSGLPENRIDDLNAEIWDVLNQAETGQTRIAPSGTVEQMQVHPYGDEHMVLGGVIWLVSVTVSFLIVGQLTLTGERENPEPISSAGGS